MEANGIYTYRILLRRKGTCDPDIPVSVEDIDIELKVKPWTEKKETSVSF